MCQVRFSPCGGSANTVPPLLLGMSGANAGVFCYITAAGSRFTLAGVETPETPWHISPLHTYTRHLSNYVFKYAIS